MLCLFHIRFQNETLKIVTAETYVLEKAPDPVNITPFHDLDLVTIHWDLKEVCVLTVYCNKPLHAGNLGLSILG